MKTISAASTNKKLTANGDAAGIQKKASRSKSFVKGALILAVGGFIGKLIGAVYRIPLTNIIGAEGMGLYQMIFPLYALLLTISSGGIPTALSRLVAEKCALGKNTEAGRMARNALISLTALGLLCAASVAALANVIARAQGNGDATLSYYAIAPAIAFVAVISALRGYFQGRENMVPSAVSQIVEQAAKLIFGLGLAVVMLPKGIAYAAAGATIGVTLSELLAMSALLIQRAFDKEKLPVDRARAYLRDTKELYRLAIPVTLGGIVMPLTQLIDSALVINILKRTTDVATATSLYGLSGGPVGSLINMPVVISLAIATAILPSVAASHTVGDGKSTRRKAGLSIRLTLLIALPCTAMFALFASPMIRMLYGRGLTVGVIDELTIASQLLAFSAPTVLLIALIQVATNLLHAVRHNYTPVINLAIGAVVKVILEITLLPRIGIFAVVASNLACYGIAALLDLIMLAKYLRPSFPVLRSVAAPLAATLLTSGIGYGLYRLMMPWSSAWGVIISIAIASVIYVLAVIIFGSLKPDEMASVPLLSRLNVFYLKKKKK